MYTKNVYQLRGTLIDKLDSFGITYTYNQKLFNNMAFFEFEGIYVEDENLKDTEKTTWTGKHNSTPISISSKLKQEPNFFCDHIPRDLVSPFIDALENFAKQSKTQRKKNFLKIETTKIK